MKGDVQPVGDEPKPAEPDHAVGFSFMDGRLVGQRLTVGPGSAAWNVTFVDCVLVLDADSKLRAEHCRFERCEVEVDGKRRPMGAWAGGAFGQGLVGTGSAIEDRRDEVRSLAGLSEAMELPEISDWTGRDDSPFVPATQWAKANAEATLRFRGFTKGADGLWRRGDTVAEVQDFMAWPVAVIAYKRSKAEDTCGPVEGAR